jgi:hypothetical protein
MANTLTGLVSTLYEALDTVARELIGFAAGATRDSGIERAAKGQTIVSPVAPAATAADITPGVTAPNDGDQVFTSASLSISKSRYVPIRWNGEEQRSLATSNNGVGAQRMLRDQFAQAFRTLVNEVEVDIFTAAYKNASRAYGTAGTTPFGTAADLSDFAGVAQILDQNGAPMSDRHLVLSSAAMANIRGKQSVLFKVNEAGTAELLRDGVVGRVEGFDLHYSAANVLVTKGTGSGYLVNNAGPYAVGTTTIELDTGTGTVLAGDIVTFTGDTNNYVVTGALGAGTSITIGAPGLRKTLANNVAMTIGNSYTPSMAFQRSGLVVATRAPAVPIDANGNAVDMADDRTIVQDPYSGIAFEVSLYRQYRQIKYEVGLAWGVGVPKQDFVATLLG